MPPSFAGNMGSVLKLLKGKIGLSGSLCAIPTFVVMSAAVHWSFFHPFGTSWDESTYINETLIDDQRLGHGMLIPLIGRILIKSWGRPPAYRVFALPFVAAFGAHATVLRLLSVSCYGLSSGLVFCATRRVASTRAAALAVLIFALSPDIVSASMWFSTEGPLYLATAGLMYFTLTCWVNEGEAKLNWVGLGVAVGIGMLAKASFIAIFIPVLAFWFLASRFARVGVPRLTSQWKAGCLALLISGPWWMCNARFVLPSIKSARGFVANSLGTPGITTWIYWLGTVFESLLGPGVSCLIGIVLLLTVLKNLVNRTATFAPKQKLIVYLCFCASAPIIVAQLTGTNDLLRHISPILIPTSIAVAILADCNGLVQTRLGGAVCAVVLGAQLGMLMVPVFVPNDKPVDPGFVNGRLAWRVMARRDQWDWSPLEDLARNKGIKAPRIAFFGLGQCLNPPALEFPWIAKRNSDKNDMTELPKVSWLWRYEEGTPDWPKILAEARRADMVLVLPRYLGVSPDEKPYNQRNREFADLISREQAFTNSSRFVVGRFKPVEVVVFLKSKL